MANHKISDLAKKIYGASDDRVKELEQMYGASQQQINDILSRFIADKSNWKGKAPKADIQKFMSQLQQLYKASSSGNQQLLDVVFNNKPLKTNGDLATASVNFAMVQLAIARKKQLADTLKVIPQEVRTNKYKAASKQVVKQLKQQLKRDPTKEEVAKSVGTDEQPYWYKLTQKAVKEVLEQNYRGTDPDSSINKEVIDTMRKLDEIVNKAIVNHQAPQDYAKEVNRLLTGEGTGGEGSLARAKMIVRTHAANTYIRSKQDDFKRRGVTMYKNQSILGSNTCTSCEDMDGTKFKVANMEPGVNAPPFHPNCQCDIVEIPDDDYSSIFD